MEVVVTKVERKHFTTLDEAKAGEGTEHDKRPFVATATFGDVEASGEGETKDAARAAAEKAVIAAAAAAGTTDSTTSTT